MKRLGYTLVGAAALALGGPASAGAAHIVEIRTALHGLARGEGFLVRAAETRRGAPAYSVAVLFLNERNVLVGRTGGTVAPGAPLTFQVNQAELPPGDPYPAVRAVLRLTREGDGTANEPFLTFEFFDSDGPKRNGGSCISLPPCVLTTLPGQARPDACVGPPARGGGPITHCEGAALTNIEPPPPPPPLLNRD